jgi:inosine/xanthosine triphosphatase
MIIRVGTDNNVKVEAVKEAIEKSSLLKDARVIKEKVDQKVLRKQPKTLEETVRGAVIRAQNAFRDCDLSVGIEDGLMRVPETKTGYMNVCVCVFFDGKDTCMGLSSGFEYPPAVTKLIFKEDLDIDEAYFRAGLTRNRDIGSSEGVVGQLTKGRYTRKDTTRYAVIMALAQIENRGLYK